MSFVNHNIPFAMADHFSPLIRETFKDSAVAQKFHSGRMKTICIINKAVAPYLHNDLVEKMKNAPFALSTDGSNDTGTTKLFDYITVNTLHLGLSCLRSIRPS